MNFTNHLQKIECRAVVERGRMYVKVERELMYVTCPKDWRQNLERGTAFSILGHLRVDGECVVQTPIAKLH
jgi:hypothetical protein